MNVFSWITQSFHVSNKYQLMIIVIMNADPSTSCVCLYMRLSAHLSPSSNSECRPLASTVRQWCEADHLSLIARHMPPQAYSWQLYVKCMIHYKFHIAFNQEVLLCFYCMPIDMHYLLSQITNVLLLHCYTVITRSNIKIRWLQPYKVYINLMWYQHTSNSDSIR